MESDKGRKPLSYLEDIRTATAIIDLNESEWEGCQEMLCTVTKSMIRTDMIYLDTIRNRCDSPWTTPGNETFFRDDFNIFKRPKAERIRTTLQKETDILICLTEERSRRIERLVKLSHATFKIGRVDFPGHPFDMLIQSPADRKCSQKEAMATFLQYLKNIKWK